MSPVRNIRLVIAYDGGHYGGWQRQKNRLAIQEVLEKALSTITAEPIQLTGAGRTDAGVHALGMNANFHTSSTISLGGLLRGLNSMLPLDIRILHTAVMPDDFHCRYSARGKTYRYDFYNGPIQLPYERLYRVHVPRVIYPEAMEQCLETILGTHDFSSFEATGSRDMTLTTGKGAVRTLFEARLQQSDSPHHFSFYFSGNGFLRYMVRNIVGTLFEAGKGKLTADAFSTILNGHDRSLAGPTAPPYGLFLMAVNYNEQPVSP